MEKTAVDYMMLDGERLEYIEFSGRYDTKEIKVRVKYYDRDENGRIITYKFGGDVEPHIIDKEFILVKYIDNILHIKTIKA